MILPDTKQWSSSHWAAVTMPPWVRKPIDAAGIFLPESCAHCVSLSGLDSAALPARVRAAMQPALAVLMSSCAMSELLRQRDADGARLCNESPQRCGHIGIEGRARDGAAHRRCVEEQLCPL